ncbi:MAG: hypothetical protein SFX18_10080 [Pirellulales bacterium]|nr:hypothetical protein [Pirellulales bacterium]
MNCNFIVRALVMGVLGSGAFVGIATTSNRTDSQPVSRQTPYAEIQCLDADTGRGIPLVELETVHGLRFVTDNAGRVALHEPDLLDQEIHLSIHAHNYHVPADGFGFRGARITPRVGQPALIKLSRSQPAERLCRLTGTGLFRDSLLLKYDIPPQSAAPSGNVAGQDSIQAARYGDKIFCLWGDTLRLAYPLGLYRMAGATLPIPNPTDPESDPADGLAYQYVTDEKSGFVRAMMPLPERPAGVIWIFGLGVAPDASGKPRLFGHYSRRKGLDGEYEQGIAVYHDELKIFQPAYELPLGEVWRRPSGHPLLHEEDGQKWIYFGSPTPNVRIPAKWEAVIDPAQYEAYTCYDPQSAGGKWRPLLSSNGEPQWRWQRDLPPVTSKQEAEWVAVGIIKPEFTRYLPVNVADGMERVQLHSGTVRWNAYRRRWILIAGQIQGTASHLGEVWYAEAKHPTGPFSKASKVATHDRQTFYNVCHHDWLDKQAGREIHFEGTYTNEFSGNPHKTARYNYNQVLYRLNLDARELREARVE